jgi:glycosyltransferase involved in cell wall biosynthesis
MTKISVVVPAYNARTTIADTLRALTSQTGVPGQLEIVVVDDGSRDETADIVRQFPTVTLVQQANAGPGAARNAGVRAASGEVILFTDSDCVPASSWAAAMADAFADPEVALVMGRSVTDRSSAYLARVQEGSDYVAREAGAPVTKFNSNNLGLRASVARALPFDGALRIYGEDSDLGWRIVTAGYKTCYRPDAELEHRHDHTYRSFFREAYLQGWGAARLHYKHGKWVPRDLLFGVLALLASLVGTLAPQPVRAAALVASGACWLLFLAALMFNELYYKRKSPWLALWTFPVQLGWYLTKLAGYLYMLARILLGREPALVESKRRFHSRQPS